MAYSAKRILIIVVSLFLALLVLAALLYFVPWPTRINHQMAGAELSVNGAVLEECTITVKGWKLNYLFQEDKIKLDTFQMNTPQTLDLHSQECSTLHGGFSEEFVFSSWLAYTSKFQPVSLYFANDNSWILFITDDRYFAVSVNGSLSPEAIWETVTSVIDFS